MAVNPPAYTIQTKSSGIKTKVAAGLIITMLLVPSVKKFEGRELEAYLDLGGVPTICDGITGKDIKIGQTATDKECDGLLGKRLEHALAVVDKSVKPYLGPYQRAGLASFVYNIGEGNFRASTLLKDLNRGQMIAACNRMRVWVFIKGKDCRIEKNKCSGLVHRREIEREYCLNTKEL